LIYWKPLTPGQRHKISIDFDALGVYTGPPVPSLSLKVPKTGGRDHTGRLRVRGRGGGEDKMLRKVDYRRVDLDVRLGDLDQNMQVYSNFLMLEYFRLV
jgi:large subunit ribosomal protein L2